MDDARAAARYADAVAHARGAGSPHDAVLLDMIKGVSRFGADPLDPVQMALATLTVHPQLLLSQLVTQMFHMMAVDGTSAPVAWHELTSALALQRPPQSEASPTPAPTAPSRAASDVPLDPPAPSSPPAPSGARSTTNQQQQQDLERRLQQAAAQPASSTPPPAAASSAARPRPTPAPRRPHMATPPAAAPAPTPYYTRGSLASTLTREDRCAMIGLDASTALAIPPWFGAELPSGVATGAVRSPTHYVTLVEEHVRRELRILERHGDIVIPVSLEQLASFFNAVDTDATLQGARYAMSRGAMLEAWARLYLYYLSERGVGNDAANALLTDLAEAARKAAAPHASSGAAIPVELRHLANSSFRTYAYDAKGHGGISELLIAVDYLFLPASDNDGETAFASIRWDVGVSLLGLLHRLTEMGRSLRFDDDRILAAWKSRVRAARDSDGLRPGEPTIRNAPGNQEQVGTLVDRYASRDTRFASVIALELQLRDDPRAHANLRPRMHDDGAFGDDAE